MPAPPPQLPGRAVLARRLSLGLAALTIGLSAQTLALLLPGQAVGASASSQLSLSAAASVTTGEPLLVSVALTWDGKPVAKHLVRLYVDGGEVGAIDTGSDGTGSTTIRSVLTAGADQLTATFHGAGAIPAATTSRPLQVVAAPFSIQVVPYVPNSIGVSVDGGAPLTPNADGFIIASFARGGLVTLNAQVHNPSPDIRVAFVAWSNNDISPTMSLEVTRKVRAEIALQISYLTKLKFVDASGHPLPRGSLSRIQLAGPDGQTISLGKGRQVWLSTPTPRKTSTGALAVGADVYTLTSANYEGVNVADQGIDRYVPRPGGVWTVRLAAFPLQVVAKNLVLGGQVGASARLTWPTGRSRRLQLPDSDGRTLVVPRGRYRLKVVSGGIGPALDVRISRSIEVPLPIVTILDLVVLALLVALLIALLVVFKPVRRWRQHRLQRQERAEEA